jgi:hypothetical protein
MSQNDAELAVAAQTGAAAAIDAVREQQQTEEQIETATVIADISANAAVEAEQAAEDARETATEAVETAVQAHNTAVVATESAGQIAEAAAQGDQELWAAINDIRTKQDAFFDRANMFFEQANQKAATSSGVQEVTVTHEPANPGTGIDSGSGKSQQRRHRFGRG